MTLVDPANLKLGRSGPSPWDSQRLSLLAPSLAGTLPTPPSSIATGRFNFFKNISWPIMGNDVYGDCVMAAAGHIIQGDTAYEKKPFTPTEDQVVKQYFDFTGGRDEGMYLLQALKPWKNTGLWGHSLAAYAEVPWLDNSLTPTQQLKLLKLTVWLSGAAYVAFNLPAGLQQHSYDWTQIGTGPAWRAGTWGGHCIPIVLYHSNGASPLFYGVSWGKLVPISVPFMRAYMDEVWFPVSNDWENAKGNTPNGRTQAELVRLAGLISQ